MRGHLYLIAHRIFARDTLKEPDTVFRMLSGADAPIFCAMQWDKAASLLPPGEAMPYPGLEVRRVEGVPNTEAFAVMFPEPKYMAECYFALIAKRPGKTPGYFVLERGGSGNAYWASYRRSPMGVMRVRGSDMQDRSPEALLRDIEGDLDLVMAPHEGGLENLDMLLPLRAPIGTTSPNASSGLGRLVKWALVLLLLVAAAAAIYVFAVEEMPYGPENKVLESKMVRPGKPFSISFVPSAEGRARYEVWAEGKSKKGFVPSTSIIVGCADKKGEIEQRYYGRDILERPPEVKSGGSARIYKYPDATDDRDHRATGAILGWWDKSSKKVYCKGVVNTKDADKLKGKRFKLKISANQRLKNMAGL